MKVNGTTILLQTKNGCNNVYVESENFNKNILLDIISTIINWYESDESLRYIRVKGFNNKYHYLCNYFKGLKDFSETDAEVFYIDLENVKEVLKNGRWNPNKND